MRQPDIRQGSQVFCRFHAGPMFLPGIVRAQNGEKIHVEYENGEKEWTTLSMVRVEEGEEVFIRPKNQPARIYTPGRIVRTQGEVIDVELEDGETESNQKVSRARFWRCPVGIQSFSCEEGDLVWAQDVDGFTYPGEILSIDNDKIIVQFLDGPERMLTPELVKAYALRAGAAVECRWKAGQNYFPGKITAIEADRVHIAYDDGDQEWTTVRLVRLPPKDGA